MTLPTDTRPFALEINGGSQDASAKNSADKKMQPQALQDEIEKLKNRVRAFTGAFVVMISPVLLAIVLKKVNISGAGRKYQGRMRTLQAFMDLVQGKFAHLAAVTLQMGIMPFLCVMVSEECVSRLPLRYVAPRLVAASKVLLFLSNLLLMALGCGILLLFHQNALLVLTFCSVMAVGVVAVHIWYLCCCVVVTVDAAQGDADTDADAEAEYQSKLEHLLELSSGVTVMMFLVLEFVALEGLLRNTHQGQGQALGPAKGQETFLGAALLISFMASALDVSLMNVWTTPHVIRGCVVLTSQFMRGLNFVLQAVPITAVVVLITLDVLPHAWKLAVFLPLFPPATLLLVLLARYSIEVMKQQEPAAAGQQEPATGSSSSATGSSTSSSDDKKPDDPKPAPLELTKVAFMGFLAVAVPSVTMLLSASHPYFLCCLVQRPFSWASCGGSSRTRPNHRRVSSKPPTMLPSSRMCPFSWPGLHSGSWLPWLFINIPQVT